MKKLSYLPVFTAFLLILSAVGTPAAALTQKSAEAFVATLDDVSVMAKEMEKEGKNKVFGTKLQPVPGEKFKPYSSALPILKKEYPADYKKLGGLVKKKGFKSPESWAATGDDVMLGFMALKMKDMPKEMPKLPPGMEDKLPPEALAGMKRGMAMMETIRDVPPAHKKIVQPLAPTIEAWMAAQGE